MDRGQPKNRFATAPYGGDTVEYATIIGNVKVERDFYNIRRNNEVDKKHEKIVGSLTDVKQINIVPGDLLLMSRKSHLLKGRKGAPVFDIKTPVFSSFTGHYTGELGENYGSAFRAVGWAAIPYDYSNESESTKDGSDLSTILAGMTTVQNNGPKVFHAMDLIKWVAPSIHPEQRALENKDRPTNKGPSSKLKPILVPYTYRDQKEWSDKALDWFLKGAFERDLIFTRTERIDQNGQIPKRDPVQQIGLGFSEFIANAALSALSVFLQLGLIEINNTALADNWKTFTVYNRIRETIKDNKVDSLKGKKLNWSANGTAVVLDEPRPEQTNFERLNQLGFIASLMGHSSEGDREDSLMPSMELMRAIVARSCHGLVADETIRKTYDIMPHITPDGLHKRAFGSGRPSFANGQLVSIQRLRNDSASNLLNSISISKRLAEESIVGISATYANKYQNMQSFK